MGSSLPPGGEDTTRGRSLAQLAAQCERLNAITRADLRPGDWVVVRTRNSIYSLCLLGDGAYQVAGGWFDRNGPSPRTVGVSGCTFGGHAIHREVVAAPGLFLEFDNGVTTSQIREARLLREGTPARH
jgi:hypothetical protein